MRAKDAQKIVTLSILSGDIVVNKVVERCAYLYRHCALNSDRVFLHERK
jgi:hypothetical protein